MFQFSGTLKEMPEFGSWNPFGIGSVNILPWRLFGQNNLAFGLFGSLHFNSNIADKFLIMWPWIILSGLGSYFLVRKITKSEMGGLIGSLVFGFNTYFLAINTQGHLLLSIASVLAVFSLLFFIKLLEEKKSYLIILTALALFFTGTSDFRILYMAIWLIFLYYLFHLFFITKPLNRKNILNSLKFIALPIILLLLLNFYWLSSSISAGSLIDNSVMNRTLFGSSFFDLSRAITLFHPFWTSGKIEWFTVQKIPFYFWLIPILALSGFILNRKNKNIIFFLLVALLGVFLSKQIDEPFGNVYRWLFEYFPGFDAFREASKFYLLTAIGYAVLIGALISWLWKTLTGQKWKTYGKYILTFLIAFIFLWNTKSMITGETGTMFAPRNIPNDYLIYKDFISKQSGFFRTLWAPTYTRWTFYNTEKRTASAVTTIGNEWKAYTSFDPSYDSWPKNEQIIDIFKKNSSDDLFDENNIKYVIVPTNDLANDVNPFYYYGGKENPDIRNWYISELDKIDWLKKINIGTKELTVYENKNYGQYIFALNNIYGLNSLDNLDDKTKFANQELKNSFNFSLLDEKTADEPLTRFESLYENIGNQAFGTSDQSLLNEKFTSSNQYSSNYLYSNNQKYKGYYSFNNQLLSLYTIPNGILFLNDKLLVDSQNEENTFFQKTLDGNRYYLAANDYIIPIKTGEKNDLPLPGEQAPLKIYSAGTNLIENPSFENGAWQEVVGDCHKYDNNPILSMSLNSQEKSAGEQSLQLEATRHIACTAQKFSVSPGEYIFSFDYQSPDSKQAGFYLQFNNQSKTIVNNTLEINDGKWHSLLKKIDVPNGADSAVLYIYAYPSDGNANNIVRYDDFEFSALNLAGEAAVPQPEKMFENILATPRKGENTFAYKDDKYNYQNIFANGSFEQGLWADKVSDCYNYDSNPSISMRLSSEQKTDGGYSLELGAKKHIACSSTSFPINGGSTYLLSFDYQGDAILAGYYVSFDDSKKTNLSEKMPIKGKGWISFTKKIKAPQGATSFRIYIYAYESDGKKKNTVRYDNFQLIEIPDLENRFYLVGKSEKKLKQPKNIDFEISSSAKKIVHIKGATTPFFLSVSEGYHDGWQLQLGNKRVDDKYHYKLNGFLNAWYVDPAELCQNNGNACIKNSDGSYNLEIIIKFEPQRWFDFGLWISEITLIACLWYLGYCFLAKKGKKEKRNRWFRVVIGTINARYSTTLKILQLAKKVCIKVLGTTQNQQKVKTDKRRGK